MKSLSEKIFDCSLEEFININLEYGTAKLHVFLF